jgi:divalent metal cation (Fe/Co/Zn/Cd) transporter
VTSPLQAAIRISVLSFGLGLALAAVALILAFLTDSLALAAFGLESLVDGSASAVLVWRFRIERRDPDRGAHIEDLARRVLAAVLLAVAIYLVIVSIHALFAGSSAHPTMGSVILASGSVVVLPLIAVQKRRLARRLNSRALRADGLLTAVAAALAVTTLASVVLNTYFDVRIADPIAALLAAGVLAREAVAAPEE